MRFFLCMAIVVVLQMLGASVGLVMAAMMACGAVLALAQDLKELIDG